MHGSGDNRMGMLTIQTFGFLCCVIFAPVSIKKYLQRKKDVLQYRDALKKAEQYRQSSGDKKEKEALKGDKDVADDPKTALKFKSDLKIEEEGIQRENAQQVA